MSFMHMAVLSMHPAGGGELRNSQKLQNGIFLYAPLQISVKASTLLQVFHI